MGVSVILPVSQTEAGEMGSISAAGHIWMGITGKRIDGNPSELGSEYIPSGHLTVCHGKSPCLIGKPYKWAISLGYVK